MPTIGKALAWMDFVQPALVPKEERQIGFLFRNMLMILHPSPGCCELFHTRPVKISIRAGMGSQDSAYLPIARRFFRQRSIVSSGV